MLQEVEVMTVILAIHGDVFVCMSDLCVLVLLRNVGCTMAVQLQCLESLRWVGTGIVGCPLVALALFHWSLLTVRRLRLSKPCNHVLWWELLREFSHATDPCGCNSIVCLACIETNMQSTRIAPGPYLVPKHPNNMSSASNHSALSSDPSLLEHREAGAPW